MLEAFPFLPEWSDSATDQWILALGSIPAQYVLKAHTEAVAGRMNCESVKYPSLPEIAVEAYRWHQMDIRYNRQVNADRAQKELQAPTPNPEDMAKRKAFIAGQLQSMNLGVPVKQIGKLEGPALVEAQKELAAYGQTTRAMTFEISPTLKAQLLGK